jgi:hypothetical protein
MKRRDFIALIGGTAAATRALKLDPSCQSTPIMETLLGCCARATSGHVAAAPPSVAKNFRRPR